MEQHQRSGRKIEYVQVQQDTFRVKVYVFKTGVISGGKSLHRA